MVALFVKRDGFLGFYSIVFNLVHSLPLRFHCVGGYWESGNEPRTVANLALACTEALTIQLDVIRSRVDLTYSFSESKDN